MVSTRISYSRCPGLDSRQIGVALLTEYLCFLCPFRQILEYRLRPGHDSCLSHSVQSAVAGTATSAVCFILVSCLAYSSVLKMGLICFYETSVNFPRTTRCCILEERAL
jgi:hypothetical protein